MKGCGGFSFPIFSVVIVPALVSNVDTSCLYIRTLIACFLYIVFLMYIRICYLRLINLVVRIYVQPIDVVTLGSCTELTLTSKSGTSFVRCGFLLCFMWLWVAKIVYDKAVVCEEDCKNGVFFPCIMYNTIYMWRDYVCTIGLWWEFVLDCIFYVCAIAFGSVYS